MGNSHSARKSPIDDYLSDSSKGVSPSRLVDDLSRRSSAGPRRAANNNFLSPHGAGQHRRSRSANAAMDPNPISAPPPYTPRGDQSSTVAGEEPPISSSHTVVGSISPPAQPLTAEAVALSSRNTHRRAPVHRNTAENVLETLRKFNTVFIVDDSWSMNGARWREARNALATLADTASKYDTDGIDLYFLNDDSVGTDLKNSAAVKRLFNHVQPQGITPIGEKLEELLLEYLSLIDDAKDSGAAAFKAIRPVNYIIITDGAPTDDPESVIVAAARRLDSRNYPMSQVGIQFVQIGNSPDATAYLRQLDDGLASNYGIRDIVDTTPYTGGELTSEVLTKILIGGINRRVDIRGAESVLNQ